MQPTNTTNFLVPAQVWQSSLVFLAGTSSCRGIPGWEEQGPSSGHSVVEQVLAQAWLGARMGASLGMGSEP